MANILVGGYNPIFYAQEALILLEKALGMAGRIHRGYDEERKTSEKGDTITITKPSTFVAQDAPSAAQDLLTSRVDIKLTRHKEVKFKVTDLQLAHGSQEIIDDHLSPAVYAIADEMDIALSSLHTDIPWFKDLASPVTVGDLTGLRRIMRDNSVPLNEPDRMHYMIDSIREDEFLKLPAFSQQQGAGDSGIATQRQGTIGQKFGFDVFANQNVQSHVKGTLDDLNPLLNGGGSPVPKGTTQITLDLVSLSGTLKKGDSLVLASNSQRYAVTADATAAGNAIVVNITPALVEDYADNVVSTISLDDHVATLAFHRNAFALATATLPEVGSDEGAKVAAIRDPRTNLSIRWRTWYDGDTSTKFASVDLLYGIVTLDPNLAVRGRG